MLITDVLSRAECVDLVSMSETVGMIEDKPVGGSAAELNSVSPIAIVTPLAHTCQGLTPLFDVLSRSSLTT